MTKVNNEGDWTKNEALWISKYVDFELPTMIEHFLCERKKMNNVAMSVIPVRCLRHVLGSN